MPRLSVTQKRRHRRTHKEEKTSGRPFGRRPAIPLRVLQGQYEYDSHVDQNHEGERDAAHQRRESSGASKFLVTRLVSAAEEVMVLRRLEKWLALTCALFPAICASGIAKLLLNTLPA